MAVQRQSTTLPPALPSCILRGHSSQVHCVHFTHQSLCLFTGDASGRVVFWKVATKRPAYVWRAHAGPILGIAQWGRERIITHGRDNTLRIWKLDLDDIMDNSAASPPDPSKDDQKLPWLLHSLPVNTLNFCSFSMCDQYTRPTEDTATSDLAYDSILVAVPATDEKSVVIWQFPNEVVKVVGIRVKTVETGMVMAVKLARHQASQQILLFVGYEAGVTAAYKLRGHGTGPVLESAQLLYLSQPHSQPILSLDASPDGDFYFTSSADAIVAMHHIPELEPDLDEGVTCSPCHKTEDEYSQSAPPVQSVVTLQPPYKITNTKHAGQQSLRVRSDGRLLVTGGWDARVRIYSSKTLKEVAVLKWHKEGVYAVAFGEPLSTADVARREEKGAFPKALHERGRTVDSKTRHWVAAGAKDGKVSLWEVF